MYSTGLHILVGSNFRQLSTGTGKGSPYTYGMSLNAFTASTALLLQLALSLAIAACSKAYEDQIKVGPSDRVSERPYIGQASWTWIAQGLWPRSEACNTALV